MINDSLQIDHNGDVLISGASGSRYNQAAFAIHAVIHNRRPDVLAVCHSHSLYGTAFASLYVFRIPPFPVELTISGALPDWINQDSLVFYDDLSLYPDFGGVVLAETESHRIADYLGTNKAIILQVRLTFILEYRLMYRIMVYLQSDNLSNLPCYGL